MLKLPIYQVNAFGTKPFSGNPAAVIMLDHWFSDHLMQQIAAQNNLPETAFLVPSTSGYSIRWFTPTYEIDLCGHATLAAAWVIFNKTEEHSNRIRLFSHLSGELNAHQQDSGQITIDLPATYPNPIPIPENASEAIGIKSQFAFKARDIILFVEDEQKVRNLKISAAAFRDWDCLALIVTAPGSKYDYVCRVFESNDTLKEDPVTGSAHAELAPLWADRLNKSQMKAAQFSKRHGELELEVKSERVLLTGKVQEYLQGEIYVKH